jgi:ornithine cyclodeaminase/alanine dehydrogenase-like protein (mu-crystallin family)
MSGPVETLSLTAAAVGRCLGPADCRVAVERALAALARGEGEPPRSVGFESPGGSFHVKTAMFPGERARFVAKLNGNFPANPATRGLPTIQGVLLISDAADGRPLAVIDSASLTAIRTAAASAAAAGCLARADATVAAIIGCGLQGAAHLDALLEVRPLAEVRLFDTDAARARDLASRASRQPGLSVHECGSAAEAARGAQVIATCTSGADFVLDDSDVEPGAFVAAVGADNPHKREIQPALMAAARVVVDDLAGCEKGGDLHHAINAGAMRAADVHAVLGAVLAGLSPGRTRDDERFVFDSTGIAIEDAAAADIVYERALSSGAGLRVSFGA